MRTLRLATRGSRLALVQANQVKAAIEALGTSDNPIRVEIKEVLTKGDKDRIHPLAAIGGKGLFVRGIEEELLAGSADLAVHSAKDLPYELAKGLVIAGVPSAADMRDLLISKKEHPVLIPHENQIDGLEYYAPNGKVDPLIGTGSPRRRIELLKKLPLARFAENRGNIPTRLQKLRDGQFDAIVLAKAGVDRLQLDLSEFDVRVFSPEEMIPAACQGILAVECRADDDEVRALLSAITDPASFRRFTLERRLFAALQADCSMAVGVSAELNPVTDQVRLMGMLDGRRRTKIGAAGETKALCEALAKELRG